MRCLTGFIIVLAAAVFLVTPSAAEAQQCYRLTYGCNLPNDGSHTASGGGTSVGEPTHATCNICPGGIFNCHAECEPTLVDRLGKEAYRSTVAAARRGDVETLIALGSLVPDYVRYNAERRAVQLLSCTGSSVLATLLVRDARLVAAAARLLPTSREFAMGTGLAPR